MEITWLMVEAAFLLWAVAHGLLFVKTKESSFYWIAVTFQALRVAERVTYRCLRPWARLWMDEFRHEAKKLATQPEPTV